MSLVEALAKAQAEFPAELPERFRRKLKVDAETGCWLWQGYIYPNGYGYTHKRIAPGKFKASYAHRVVYEILVGPIEHTIDHVWARGCRYKHCCNPAHLEDVPQRVNILRSTSFAAKNAAKTHCVRGHEFSPDNVRITPQGRRDCLKCCAIRQAMVRERRKAAAI